MNKAHHDHSKLLAHQTDGPAATSRLRQSPGTGICNQSLAYCLTHGSTIRVPHNFLKFYSSTGTAPVPRKPGHTNPTKRPHGAPPF